MDALTIKDIAIISTPFLLFALGVVVTAVGFLLRGLITDLKVQIKEAVVKADKVEIDLMDFKAQMPRQYVLKDDYIRTISVFEGKLDDIGKEIKAIAGRKDAKP